MVYVFDYTTYDGYVLRVPRPIAWLWCKLTSRTLDYAETTDGY